MKRNDDFYEDDEDLADVLAAFERGVKRVTEPLRRELAQRHKDDFDVDDAVPVRRKRLDSIHSVRFTADEVAALREGMDRMGLPGISALLRFAARRMIEPIGFRCEHASMSCGGGFVSVIGGCGCEMQPVYPMSAA